MQPPPYVQRSRWHKRPMPRERMRDDAPGVFVHVMPTISLRCAYGAETCSAERPSRAEAFPPATCTGPNR
jgi:hypothetical protein